MRGCRLNLLPSSPNHHCEHELMDILMGNKTKPTTATTTTPRKKGQLPTKICATCGRAFEWRKKWAKNWEQVRYCSERCRRSSRKNSSADNGDEHF